MSLFGKIWWLFWGIAGTVCGTLLVIFDEKQRLRWGFSLLVPVMILMTVIGSIRKERREKRKVASGNVKEKAKDVKTKTGRCKKTWVILVLAAIAALAAVFVLLSPSSAPRGAPVAEFDFPVWALRDGNVAVFEKQILYSNASEKYIVVANVGDEPETDIPVYDKVPAGIAERASELSFNVKPDIINASDSLVLKYTVDTLAPQTSKVFTIASPNGLNRTSSLCEGAGTGDCASAAKDAILTMHEGSLTSYEAEYEKIAAVYDGAAQDLTAAQAAFYEKIKSQSERVIEQTKSAEPRGILASARASIDGAKAWVLSAYRKLKEASGGEQAGEQEKTAEPEPVKSTSLTAETFPKEVTKAFALAAAKDINRLDFHCKSIAPLKAMVAAYTIPEIYRRGLTPGKKTSQKVEVGVYATVEEAHEAGKACGRGYYRVVGTEKPFPGRLWRDGSVELITNPWTAFVGQYRNYLIYAPVEAMGFAVDTKLFPAIAEEIKKNE